MPQSILIIGGGIAGLAAGCYARMNGYETEILEANDRPGGLCTSWTRKDYTIDGCLRWLVGSRTGTALNHVWRELGVLPDRELVRHEELVRVAGPGGKVLVAYTDPDRLEQHLLSLAPDDAAPIREFVSAIRRFTKFDILLPKPGRLASMKLAAKMAPYLGQMQALGTVSIGQFAGRFKDPFLREAFPMMFFGLRDCQLLTLVMALAGFASGDSTYPIGGSLALARSIEARYLALGGRITYGARVERVLVEEGGAAGFRAGAKGARAVGALLADGGERRADIVLSACDGHETVYELLGGRFLTDRIRLDYERRATPIYPPYLQVALGVDLDFSDEPHAVVYRLKQPLIIAGEKHEWLGVQHYGYDPTMAPAGKSVVKASFLTGYDYWKNLRDYDREHYQEEKKSLADAVIACLGEIYEGFGKHVEVVDVATPATFERYTRTWRGSFMGWMAVPGLAYPPRSKTIPGLDGFYMCGQWVEQGGGVPTAAASGRVAVSLICRDGGKTFLTSER